MERRAFLAAAGTLAATAAPVPHARIAAIITTYRMLIYAGIEWLE